MTSATQSHKEEPVYAHPDLFMTALFVHCCVCLLPLVQNFPLPARGTGIASQPLPRKDAKGFASTLPPPGPDRGEGE